MRVVFRVDASLQIGTGHVRRCLTLAKALKENGSTVDFICRKHVGNLINKIRSTGFNVFELELLSEDSINNKLFHSQWLGTSQEQDAIECAGILKLMEVDWLIVDHYGIDEDWQQLLEEYYNKLMVIDDLADRKHKCDILLDQTHGRQDQEYRSIVPKSCGLLLGSHYALLRPEFAKWRQYSLERRKRPELNHLLINMGGIDLENFTLRILNEITSSNLPSDIVITVVLGNNSPHQDCIRAKVATMPFKIEVKYDVDNMAEIMANSDLAIGAGGATSWERCCLGLATIQIITAHNQQLIAKNLHKVNAAKLSKVNSLSKLLNTAKQWMLDVSGNASKICNGTGASIVIKYLQ